MPSQKVDEQIRTRAARRNAHAIHMRPPLSSDTQVGCLTTLASLVSPGVSAKERPSRAWGEGEGRGGIWDHMSSNDVGSHVLERSSCEMHMG